MTDCHRHHVGRNCAVLWQDIEHAGFRIRRGKPAADGSERRWHIRHTAGGHLNLVFTPGADGYDLTLRLPQTLTAGGWRRVQQRRDELIAVLDTSFNVRPDAWIDHPVGVQPAFDHDEADTPGWHELHET